MSIFTIDFFDFSSKKIILKGNNGGYLSRIDRKHLNLGQLIEAAKRIKDKYCEFIISQVDDTNYFVFQSDDGRYWTRLDRSNVRIGSNVSSDSYQISQIIQAVKTNIDQSYKFRLYVVS